MNRTLAIGLIAIGVILAILSILQHDLVIHVRVDHFAVILLALGLIAIFAGVFGYVMQGRSSVPPA
jgi:hypothetical protein